MNLARCWCSSPKATDTSISLIEHNFSLVHRVAERYYVMSKGAVVEEGLPAQTFQGEPEKACRGMRSRQCIQTQLRCAAPR